MRANPHLLAVAIAAVFACAAGPAGAAGGHHAVDDAAILDPGQCELEGWFNRARASGRLVHAGLNCRLGPVEVGGAGEYARFQAEDGRASATDWVLEVKWATEIADGFSLGAKVGPVWAARVRPGYQGAAVVSLASWEPRDNLALHFNLGRDLVHHGGDQGRYGAAVEWAPGKAWSLLGERFKEGATHFVRVGARLSGGGRWSVDLSRAQRLHGPGVSAWTLGATALFDRK